MQMDIRFKKCGISNQPNVCIFDDPCFSKFGALRGSCPHPGRQFVGLLCVSLMAPLNSIRRHCLGAVSGHQKVRPLSPVCRTCTRRIVQTWKRHGIRCKHSAGRNSHIFLKRIFHLHFHMKSPSVFLIILLITQKQSMLIATILLILDKMPAVVYDTDS